MNFNSDEAEVNNNNRYVGLSVRGVVGELSSNNIAYVKAIHIGFLISHLLRFKMYSITRNGLLFDLYHAFVCAKRHKNDKPYVVEFEKDLFGNLVSLCDELYERRYKPLPSVCFIIEDPKKREVFAANFRDRIVHHLYYNYTYDMFNSTFIEDSYSCRLGKGTHYGINRLSKHIRKETDNYTKTAYALKMDIKGYFIHIDRNLLLDIVINLLDKMKHRLIPNNEGRERYCDKIDIEFVKYLSREIIMLNPVKNCIMKSSYDKWADLDYSKSLFHTKENCGLPIGNLTSQLFSNLYLLSCYIALIISL